MTLRLRPSLPHYASLCSVILFHSCYGPHVHRWAYRHPAYDAEVDIWRALRASARAPISSGGRAIGVACPRRLPQQSVIRCRTQMFRALELLFIGFIYYALHQLWRKHPLVTVVQQLDYDLLRGVYIYDSTASSAAVAAEPFNESTI